MDAKREEKRKRKEGATGEWKEQRKESELAVEMITSEVKERKLKFPKRIARFQFEFVEKRQREELTFIEMMIACLM